MDNFRIDIGTGNAAFKDPEELGRILRGIARDVDAGAKSGKVRDSNGNTIGRFDFLQNIE